MTNAEKRFYIFMKQKKLIYICAGSLICAVFVALIFFNNFRFTFKGDSHIEFEYGETCFPAKPSATFKGNLLFTDGMSVSISTTDTIDSSKIGEQTITYETSYLCFKDTFTQTVVIKDSEAPIISLTGNNKVDVLYGHTYEEEGFTATDNYDGDITDKVIREVRDNNIHYSVSDTYGNTTEVIREITYIDPLAPALTLKGEAVYTLYKGSPYVEDGFTAIDNLDIDITDKVVASGVVNTDVCGTYTITYTVCDDFGHSDTVTRTINVIDNHNVASNDNKVIYLTFDDGPSKYTSKLLDILDRYDVKATFFVVGNNARHSLIDTAAKRGHSIGIHSYSHKYESVYRNLDAYKRDLTAMQDIILENAKIKTYLVRFPGGSSNSISKRYCSGVMTQSAKYLSDNGFVYFDWNVSSEDAEGKLTRTEIKNNVINGILSQTKNPSIVLQHDIFEESVLAVEDIIIWGKANGYTFAPLSMDSFNAHHRISN